LSVPPSGIACCGAGAIVPGVVGAFSVGALGAGAAPGSLAPLGALVAGDVSGSAPGPGPCVRRQAAAANSSKSAIRFIVTP
jgi:hypothetical protein